jgi:hypothetical protein
MSTTNDDLPVEGFSPGAASIADLLKQDYNEIAEIEEVYIKVKGYDKSGLQVKYRLPESGKELDDISRKVNREYKDTYSRNLFTAIDTMIYLCEGLYVQPEGVEAPVMLDPQETGMPCRFDERLAVLIGMNGVESRARAVVRKLFNNNDLMVVGHAERLSRWLTDTKANLEIEFWQLGE